ncbi:MAG: formylglycine-generating enzyme family protein [Planctomycetes bacterium]|nr:formylglycine-generating enzyme family protein [Planctomycetota bacterium]
MRWFERHLPVVKAGSSVVEDTRSTADEDQLINSLGMKLVKVPAGKFTMGSPDDEPGRDDDEEQYPVEITRAFYLGRNEVTLGQFRAFVRNAGYVTEPERDGVGGTRYTEQAGETWKLKGREPQYTWKHTGLPQSDDHPVANVTWNDAVAFCGWLSRKEGRVYRLPTEAEWEYSCRAHTTTRYYSGDDEGSLARVANLADEAGKLRFPHWRATVSHDDGQPSTAPVGSFGPNAFGMHDMHGNLWEWCADWYGADYYRGNPRRDPQGPAVGTQRVARGGCWNEAARTARAAGPQQGSALLPQHRRGIPRAAGVVCCAGLQGIGCHPPCSWCCCCWSYMGCHVNMGSALTVRSASILSPYPSHSFSGGSQPAPSRVIGKDRSTC